MIIMHEGISARMFRRAQLRLTTRIGCRIIACLFLVSILIGPLINVYALSSVASGTFPAGTYVVPMDGKQADRIRVYGFIHEFLRLTPNGEVARIIEPPDVTIQTVLTPSGALYQGGPFLISQSFRTAINNLLMNVTFSKVTVTQLLTPFTSNQIFFVKQATRILVIRGIWGRTDLTLSRMGITYTLVTPRQILANPSMINNYTLIVLDSPGWYGNPCGPGAVGCSYQALHGEISTVYNLIRDRVQAGNEVIYTDISMLDLNSTFPGYIQLGHIGQAGSWPSTVYSPAKPNFPSEFPIQYYNPGPKPNNVVIFTESGGGLWVPTGVQPAHVQDVRVVMDSVHFGVPKIPYAILGFYFQFGNGIVEGLAFQPYQQLYPTYADYNGYYATYEIYGNKFVHGPQNDFLISANPASVTVEQGQSATFTIGVTSVGSFSSPVSMQVSGTPFNSAGSFSPPLVTPPVGGSTSSLLVVSTASNTPPGTYNLTVTGTSTLPQLERQTSVTLTVTAAVAPPADFTLSVSPAAPTPLVVQPGQCGNYSVSVQSIGSFMSPVNLSLSNIPTPISGHLKSQFIPNPVTPPSPGATVFSTLQACAANDAAPGNYTMTVIGSGGGATHSADVVLQIPRPPTVPFNPLVYLIILLGLLIGLGIGLLAAYLSRKGVIRRKPRFQYVLPLPTIRCRNCGRLMPMAAVYCPYCGRPQVIMAKPPRVRAAVMPRVTGRRVIPFVLSLVSGILVLLNSAALLSPSFYGFWSTVFFWLPILGPTYAFALGVLIGLTIIFASIIMILSSGALADVIVFPFAVFSLIIGGGFIAGMIIGIIAGILAVLKR